MFKQYQILFKFRVFNYNKLNLMNKIKKIKKIKISIINIEDQGLIIMETKLLKQKVNIYLKKLSIMMTFYLMKMKIHQDQLQISELTNIINQKKMNMIICLIQYKMKKIILVQLILKTRLVKNKQLQMNKNKRCKRKDMLLYLQMKYKRKADVSNKFIKLIVLQRIKMCTLTTRNFPKIQVS